jgi:hypothetical protein
MTNPRLGALSMAGGGHCSACYRILARAESKLQIGVWGSMNPPTLRALMIQECPP